MIAVDTNVLVHAHREDSPWHGPALDALGRLAGATWAIPWPCVHEFMAIATHPRIFDPPSPLKDAIACAEGWLETPSLRLLAETEGYWSTLRELVGSAGVVGPRVHDARIAALCVHHGVDTLWSADRDFSRFPRLNVRNPLVG
ncbi:MAG: type II toxin-antitoxin system VapC family toxin [Myxococcota bacterium]